MVDAEGAPIRARGYRLTLPDGSVRTGTLNDQGTLRFDDLDPAVPTETEETEETETETETETAPALAA